MPRTAWMLTLALAALLLAGAGPATADTVVYPPAVSYYVPPPPVTCYSPPVVYTAPPRVTYYAPPPVAYYPAPAAVTTTRYGLFGRPRVTTRYYVVP